MHNNLYWTYFQSINRFKSNRMKILGFNLWNILTFRITFFGLFLTIVLIFAKNSEKK